MSLKSGSVPCVKSTLKCQKRDTCFEFFHVGGVAPMLTSLNLKLFADPRTTF